ncbi:MAG: hypothetical protein WCS99_08670 [Limisphaerales bacterium]
MQTFAKKQIAVAVGASLLVMAGAANAAGVNPTVRTKGIVATIPAGAAAAQALYSATGYSGAIQATIYLQPAADTVTPADSQAISDAGVLINNIAGGGATGAGATSVNNDFSITYGATPVYFPITAGGITFTANTTVGGVALVAAKAAGAYATYLVNLGKVAADTNGAFRINGANLEYTQDNTVAAPVWEVVNVQGYTATANPITSTDDPTGAPATLATFTSAAAPAVMGTAPTPKLSTHSTSTVNGGKTIDGLTIDTLTPIATLTKTTNFLVQAEGTVTTGCAGSTIVDNKDITAGATGTVAATGTANTVLFATPATVTWTAAPAGDAAAYSTTCFNTGVTGTAVPFTVTLVGGAEPAYSNVFTPATGNATLMAALPANNTITDGAAPVFVSAESTSLTAPSDLVLTFSEPIAGIAADSAGGLDGQDNREVAENVKLGADVVAALGLNAGWNVTIATATTAGGQGTLSISGIDPAEFSKQVAVTKGISVKEQGDAAWSSTVDALDNAGIKTVGNEFIAAVAATTITPAKPTIAFTNVDTDLKASATPISNDPTKIGQIDIKATAGNEMALGSGKTLTHLAAHLIVTITGKYANKPAVFKFYPTSTDVAVTAGGLTITLPTKLIYEKIDSANDITVTYTATVDGVSDVLVAQADSTVIVTAGTENVSIPVSMTAGALDNTLLTQSIIGSFNSTANGDKVEAYLARWDDTPAATDVSNVTVGQAKIGSQYADIYRSCGTGCGTSTADLQSLVEAQLDAVAAATLAVPGVSNASPAGLAQPIPGYVVGNKIFVADDGTGKSDVRLAYDNAVNAARSLSSDIRNAARNAGSQGASATGASMNDTNNSGTSNAGSLNAAMNAGVAAALASLANDASGFNLPDATVLAARTAAAAPNATVSGVTAAILASDLGMGWIQPVNIDPIKGAITGRDGGKASGSVELKNALTAGDRGLKLLDNTGKFTVPSGITAVNGAAVVGTVNGVSDRFNLLLGTDPKTNDLQSIRKPTFVLLVHTSAVDGSQRLLTSADPLAANFLPYEPNLMSGLGTRKDMAIDLSKIRKVTPAASTQWALYGFGNPAHAATPPLNHKPLFERRFVGLNSTGLPVSLWTNDGNSKDLALAMVGNKTTVATELKSNGETLSTIAPTSFVAGAVGLAWANDVSTDNTKPMFIQQGAAMTSKVPVGWSLVTVPSTGLLPTATVVNAVIKVGSQLASGKQYTWVTGDTTAPVLSAGEAVFVYSKLGGALN